MKVELKQGETINVVLADSDGEFVIQYGNGKVTVFAPLPDSTGREGIIYQEEFGAPDEEEDLEVDEEEENEDE